MVKSLVMNGKLHDLRSNTGATLPDFSLLGSFLVCFIV